jgi:hypothetical protein
MTAPLGSVTEPLSDPVDTGTGETGRAVAFELADWASSLGPGATMETARIAAANKTGIEAEIEGSDKAGIE